MESKNPKAFSIKRVVIAVVTILFTFSLIISGSIWYTIKYFSEDSTKPLCNQTAPLNLNKDFDKAIEIYKSKYENESTSNYLDLTNCIKIEYKELVDTETQIVPSYPKNDINLIPEYYTIYVDNAFVDESDLQKSILISKQLNLAFQLAIWPSEKENGLMEQSCLQRETQALRHQIMYINRFNQSEISDLII